MTVPDTWSLDLAIAAAQLRRAAERLRGDRDFMLPIIQMTPFATAELFDQARAEAPVSHESSVLRAGAGSLRLIYCTLDCTV